MDIFESIHELNEKRKLNKLGGGLQKINKQYQKGKKTARERIDYLLDKGTFIELNSFMKHRNVEELGFNESLMGGEGVVTGYGEINGKPIYLYAQDFTVLGGSVGEVHAKKIINVIDMAAKTGVPLIGINDSGGARIQEGISALDGYGKIFYRNVIYSGVIPQISILMGPNAGGAVYSPALTDFIIMVDKTSQMFITGPKVMETVTGERVSAEELGGANIHHSKSGNAHIVEIGRASCRERV